MSTLTRAAHKQVAWLVDHVVPTPNKALAQPPAGSGLRPVLGDQGLPLAGYTSHFLADPVGFARRRYASHGPVSWMGFLGTRAVFVLDPDGIGEVLANKEKAFANGPGWGYFLGPFFERGVMLLDFEEHLSHRRIMQEAFGRDRLKGYLSTMNACTDRGVTPWAASRDLKLYDAIKELLLEQATEVFLGEELGAEADELNRAFVDTVVAGLSVVRADVPGGGWHRGLIGRRRLEEYFRAQLPAKRAGNGDDLFSQLCRAQTREGDSFTDDDIVNHMIFLLMAAHDTSTITASMLAYYLAKHPEWQARLREEARALGKAQLEYDDLEQLPLMDLAFRETLRLNPPVGVMARQAVKDTSVGGHFIPAGTKVVVAPLALHRIEAFWKNPDTFDPERFSDERAEDKENRYKWSPFGGGAHKCIGMYFGGMQVKAILHQLLLRYEWSVPAGYEPPMEYATGPWPADGLPVRLTALRVAASRD